MKMARALQALTLLLLLWALLGLLGWFWGAAWWLLLGMLLLALVHVPLMALELALQRRIGRNDPLPRAGAGELLYAWAAEAAGAVRLFAWEMPWRWRRFADHLPAGAMGRRGLILVHGFVCNRGIWNPWWPQLRAAGVPCIAPNLEPVFGTIDDYVPLIEAAVQRMSAATGLPPLLVAHSMGGLVLRAWLRDSGGDARVHGVITIGTPHHGTWLGRFGLAPNTRQMRWHSPWLAELAAREPPERYRRFTCFYGHCDNIVFPCSTATLPGADNRHLRGHAHVHLLRHPAVLAEVLRRLQT
jgi:triacylglycerol lipase